MKENKYKFTHRTQERLRRALLSYEDKRTLLDQTKIDISLNPNSFPDSSNDVLHGLVTSESTQSVITALYNKCIIATCLGYTHSLEPDQMRAVIVGVQAMRLNPFIFTEARNEAAKNEFDTNHVACIASVISPDNIQPITVMRKNEEWRKLYWMLQYSLTASNKSLPSSLVDIDLLQLEDWQRIAVSEEVAQISKIPELKKEQQNRLEQFSLEMRTNEVQNLAVLEKKKAKLQKIRTDLSNRLEEEAKKFIDSRGKELNIQNKQESVQHFAEVAIDLIFWMGKTSDNLQETKVIILGMHKEPKFVSRVRDQAEYFFGRNTHSINYIDIKLELAPENKLDERDGIIDTQDDLISISEEEVEIRNIEEAEENKLFRDLSKELTNEGKINQVIALIKAMAADRAKEKASQNQQLFKNKSSPLGGSPPNSSPLDQFATTPSTSPKATKTTSIYSRAHTTFLSPNNASRSLEPQEPGILSPFSPEPVATLRRNKMG